MTPVIVRIREWREKRGLSQTALAEAAETSQKTISKLETGKTGRVEFELLDKIAQVLDCRVEDLIRSD